MHNHQLRLWVPQVEVRRRRGQRVLTRGEVLLQLSLQRMRIRMIDARTKQGSLLGRRTAL